MRDPGARWTDRDRMYAQALAQYEAGLCPGCGQPKHHTMADPPRNYAVESGICSACEEMEQAREQKNHQQPGMKLWTVEDD